MASVDVHVNTSNFQHLFKQVGSSVSRLVGLLSPVATATLGKLEAVKRTPPISLCQRLGAPRGSTLRADSAVLLGSRLGFKGERKDSSVGFCGQS